MLLIAILFIISLREKNEDNLNTKEHQLYFLYPTVKWIIKKTRLTIYLNKNITTRNHIKAIYVTQKPEQHLKLYWYKKGALIILIVFIFNLLSLVYKLQNSNSQTIQENNLIKRPTHGQGIDELELTVDIDSDASGDIENELESSKDIILKIEERRLNKQELELAFEEAKEYLDKSLLGGNETLDFVSKDLYFCSKIPSTSILVKWQPEDPNLISNSGKVLNEEISSNGVITTVRAALVYGEERIDYIIPLRIMPKEYTKEEELTIALNEEINKASEETIYDESIKLPDTVGDYQVNWSVREDKTGTFILVIGIVLAILMWFQEDKNLEKKVQMRKNQMLLDYPEIINKFTLLVNAGMTIKQAWLRISEDYVMKIEKGVNIHRYAYDEMIITAREISLGISETVAYEQFGKRAGLLPYMKFATLIAQNLKKGSKGLSQILNNEATEAFEERKEVAKKMGEEAGTKLLLPMMMMLIIVLIIIIIPAFISFNI